MNERAVATAFVHCGVKLFMLFTLFLRFVLFYLAGKPKLASYSLIGKHGIHFFTNYNEREMHDIFELLRYVNFSLFKIQTTFDHYYPLVVIQLHAIIEHRNVKSKKSCIFHVTIHIYVIWFHSTAFFFTFIPHEYSITNSQLSLHIKDNL